MQDFEVLPSRVWEDHWGSHVWTWRSSPIWFLLSFAQHLQIFGADESAEIWVNSSCLHDWLQLTTAADIGDPRAPSFF